MATVLTGDALKGAVLAHGGDPAAIGSEDAQRAFVEAKLQAIAAGRAVNELKLNWNGGKALAIFNFAAAIAVFLLMANPTVAAVVAGGVVLVEGIFLGIRHKLNSKDAWKLWFNAMKAELIALAITVFVAFGLAEGVVLLVAIAIWIADGVREWKNS